MGPHIRDPRRRVLLVAAMLSLAACAAPTGADGPPSLFQASVTGAFTETISGTAAVADDWSRQMVRELTPPIGGTITGILLSSDDLTQSVSLSKRGTGLATGTFRIGSGIEAGSSALPFFGAYVRWEPQTMRVFAADSGSVTITVVGTRVQGTFTLWASRYDVLKRPPRGSGQSGILERLESGTAAVQITGSFDASAP